jgi:hypothetical protein
VDCHQAGISIRPTREEIRKTVVLYEKEDYCDFVNLEKFSRIDQVRGLAQLFDSAAF